MNNMSTTMRLNLHHLNLRSLETINAWVKKQLFALGQAPHIDEANVLLMRHENASPTYQVNPSHSGAKRVCREPRPHVAGGGG